MGTKFVRFPCPRPRRISGTGFEIWRPRDAMNALKPVFLCLWCAICGTSSLAKQPKRYRPVVVMHGVYGSANNSYGYPKNIRAIKEQFPGIYVRALTVSNKSLSVITPMHVQLQGVIQTIQAD